MSKNHANRFWWLLVVCIALLNLAAWRRPQLSAWIGSMAVRAAGQESSDVQSLIAIATWLDPHSPQAALARARIARRNSNLREFNAELTRARFLGLDAEKAEREKWLSLAQSGQMRLVKDKLAELTDAPDGDEAEICEAYAIGFMRTREFASALSLLNAWALDFPKDARPHAWMGQIYQELKDLEKSEAAYRKALSLNSGNSSAALGLGNLLLELKRSEEARQYFSIAANDPQTAASAGAGLANSLLTLGQTEEAARVLQGLLESEPNNHELLTSLANLFVEQGEYQKAEELLRGEVEAGCSRRELRYAYALALRGVGDAESASQHFDYATLAAKEIIRANQRIPEVAKQPQDLELRYDIGATLLKYGNIEDGLMWLQGILEMEPVHRATHRALGEHYMLQTDRDPLAAIKARQHFAFAGPENAGALPKTQK